MSIEHPSPPRFSGRDWNRSTLNDKLETPTAMFKRVVIEAMQSKEVDLHDTISINSTPFYLVCPNDNHKNSHCKQIKSTAVFIRTRNWNFSNFRNRQSAASSVQPCQQPRYQQGRSRQGGWSNFNRIKSFNENPKLSSSAG